MEDIPPLRRLMSRKAPKPCSAPGCQALTRERFCTRHQCSYQRQDQRRRGTATQRGYGARWRRARRLFLIGHPLCAECLRDGRTTAATVVDHKQPHQGDPALFWDESNWQALCSRCHNRKTATEDGGFGHPRHRAPQHGK